MVRWCSKSSARPLRRIGELSQQARNETRGLRPVNVRPAKRGLIDAWTRLLHRIEDDEQAHTDGRPEQRGRNKHQERFREHNTINPALLHYPPATPPTHCQCYQCFANPHPRNRRILQQGIFSLTRNSHFGHNLVLQQRICCVATQYADFLARRFAIISSLSIIALTKAGRQ